MVGVAKKLMDKAGKEGKLYDYRVTPQSGSIASPLQLMTQHTKGERSAPASKHFRHPRNVPNSTRTHEEARKQTRKELH